MKQQELYQLIDLQPEIIKRLEAVGGELELLPLVPYLDKMSDIRTAEQAYDQLQTLFQKEADTDHLKMLYCQLECAGRVFDRYREKGIPQTIYRDTMKCFTRFLAECEKKNGRLFFDRGWWTYRQLSMSLFRIGELEYEFCEHEGARAIGIHIPSDADLSEKAVDRSLEQAAVFFGTYYSAYAYDTYTCHSWLLSPALGTLLSAKSNILSFQKRFTIVKEDAEDKEYIEWLFQTSPDTDYRELPETTSLQKKVKTMLLSGGLIGSAYGLLQKGE